MKTMKKKKILDKATNMKYLNIGRQSRALTNTIGCIQLEFKFKLQQCSSLTESINVTIKNKFRNLNTIMLYNETLNRQ